MENTVNVLLDCSVVSCKRSGTILGCNQLPKWAHENSSAENQIYKLLMGEIQMESHSAHNFLNIALILLLARVIAITTLLPPLFMPWISRHLRDKKENDIKAKSQSFQKIRFSELNVKFLSSLEKLN